MPMPTPNPVLALWLILELVAKAVLIPELVVIDVDDSWSNEFVEFMIKEVGEVLMMILEIEAADEEAAVAVAVEPYGASIIVKEAPVPVPVEPDGASIILKV